MNTAYQKQTETITMAKDVLVIGSGATAVQAASRLSSAGYPVTLAGPGKLSAGKGVEVLSESAVLEVTGMPGDFTVKLAASGAAVAKKAGAIVVASDLAVTPLFDAYGLKPAANVLSLSEFEAALSDDANRGKLLSGEKIVVFLAGFAKEGNPLLMRRILTGVDTATGVKGCTVYVYINNIKVADDGLERLYKKGRDKGATYFKLQQAPKVVQDGGKLSVTFHDPVLRSDIEVSPDIIVCEEALNADASHPALARALRIDLGPADFLQKENVHRLPVGSNREGIFVVGTARDVGNPAKSSADVENMLLRVRQLIGEGSLSATVKAVVDRDKCVTCLTCYRCCPHGAITWDSKAVISPVACQGCGICASECPMDAIQLVDFTDTEITDRVKTAATAADAPKIIAFCCQNSAFEAGRMADVFGYGLPKGLQMIKVPCAGKIDIQYILNALLEADGVLVLACHTGNCKSELGNTYAKWRVTDAYAKLEQVGIEKDRLVFATLASNMAADFAKIAKEMEAGLKALK